MIDYERGLYVVIEQLAKGPHPFPLEHGFSRHHAYRVLGIYNPSESGECWLILSNDRDELWYIAQRHVRTWALDPNSTAFRVPCQRVERHPERTPPIAASAEASYAGRPPPLGVAVDTHSASSTATT